MLTTIDIETQEKQCRVCHEYYPLDYFHQKKDSRDGRATICKDCHREEQAQRYQAGKAEEVKRRESFAPENPWGYLARAIIKQACIDWTRRGCDKRGLILFFNSFWFESLADLAGVSPVAVRERLGIR